MKRILGVLIGIATMVTLFGCGGDGSSSSDTGTKTDFSAAAGNYKASITYTSGAEAGKTEEYANVFIIDSDGNVTGTEHDSKGAVVSGKLTVPSKSTVFNMNLSGTEWNVTIQAELNTATGTITGTGSCTGGNFTLSAVKIPNFAAAVGNYKVTATMTSGAHSGEIKENVDTLTIDLYGNVTGTKDPQGDFFSGKLTATSTSTKFTINATGPGNMTIQGTLDTSTGTMSGTGTSTDGNLNWTAAKI